MYIEIDIEENLLKYSNGCAVSRILVWVASESHPFVRVFDLWLLGLGAYAQDLIIVLRWESHKVYRSRVEDEVRQTL